MQKRLLLIVSLSLLVSASPGFSEVSRGQGAPAQLSYADLADLSADTPLVMEARIRSSVRVKAERAVNLAPGHQRFYVEAQVLSLIRGQGGIGRDINYIVDLPVDYRGKTPKLKKRQVLLFARSVAGRPGSIQLVAPDAQITSSPAYAATLRTILAEAVGPDAPPRITGVGNAFHSPGSIPGEGETQIFLNTADRRPVSLSIIRRPGQQAQWAVSLGEIVDESAATPVRDSLLWYRLACFLPRNLPERAQAQLDSTNAAIAREDYQMVLRGLGPCQRTRAARRQ